MEDAQHARLHVDTAALRAHDAQRADMLVVAEDIVVGEPEALCPHPGEPSAELITPPNVSPMECLAGTCQITSMAIRAARAS